jgi:predicted nucleic acid-binding Zn ribbon protein
MLLQTNQVRKNQESLPLPQHLSQKTQQMVKIERKRKKKMMIMMAETLS